MTTIANKQLKWNKNNCENGSHKNSSQPNIYVAKHSIVEIIYLRGKRQPRNLLDFCTIRGPCAVNSLPCTTERPSNKQNNQQHNGPTDRPSDNKLTKQPTDWLTDWLTHHMTRWTTNQPADQSTEHQTNDQPTDKLTIRQTESIQMLDWPTNRQTNRLNDPPNDPMSKSLCVSLTIHQSYPTIPASEETTNEVVRFLDNYRSIHSKINL